MSEAGKNPKDQTPKPKGKEAEAEAEAEEKSVWELSDEEVAARMGALIARDQARDPGSWGGWQRARAVQRKREREARRYLK